MLYFYALYTSKDLRKTRRTPLPPTMYRPSLVYLSVIFASRSVLAEFFCKYTVAISFLCFSWLVGDQVGFGLHLHADCKTIAVQSGDGCASLAARCGLSGNTFMSYNPRLDCSKLVVDQVSDLLLSRSAILILTTQWVCCTLGTLPSKYGRLTSFLLQR